MMFEKIAKWTRSCVFLYVVFPRFFVFIEKLQSGQEVAFNVVLSLRQVLFHTS
ncbi:MAG TPA: hypothetical protein PLD56_10385 [Chitinophagales bacterium]|nr:hypothetical protein [Chitinophagales bacterium]